MQLTHLDGSTQDYETVVFVAFANLAAVRMGSTASRHDMLQDCPLRQYHWLRDCDQHPAPVDSRQARDRSMSRLNANRLTRLNRFLLHAWREVDSRPRFYYLQERKFTQYEPE